MNLSHIELIAFSDAISRAPNFMAVLFTLGVILVIVMAIVGGRQAKARREALAMVARSLGWSFDGNGKDRTFKDRYSQFQCFKRGSSRYAYNRMWGDVRWGNFTLSFQAGDYHYEESSGSGDDARTSTYRFSYLLVRLPWGNRLPELTLRNENFFDKMIGVIGIEDIDFESAEFSKRYFVNSSDRKLTYDVLHPRMIEWMLAVPPPSLILAGGYLLLNSGINGPCWDPGEFERKVRWVQEFLSRWPEYVVKDLSS